MPKQSEIAVLAVNGKRYGAWKSFWLRREYGAPASDFEFTAAEPIDATGAFQDWRIQPGDSCNITLAGILALTGHIEVRQGSYNAREHGVMFRGRSNTADAVDSSASVKGGQFRNYTFGQIAGALLKPTGVNLVVAGNAPDLARPFENFSIRLGETVHMAIERLARLRNMRITDDAKGNYVASYSGSTGGSGAALVEGQNILEARATIDVSQSYGTTDVRAQHQGSDTNWPANDYAATATSSGRQTRRKIVLLEEPGLAKDALTRTLHELAFSGTAQIDCSCMVQGWQSSPGTLWDVNQTYTVSSPMLDLDRQLKSRVVTYAQDDDYGTITTIELCTPESLTGSADIASTGSGGGGKGDPAYAGAGASGSSIQPPDNGAV